MSDDIIDAMLRRPAQVFENITEDGFSIGSVKFTFATASQPGWWFGKKISLLADGLPVFVGDEISVRGGMGNQVHDTYSPIVDLQKRLRRISEDRAKLAAAAKAVEVLKLLQAKP